MGNPSEKWIYSLGSAVLRKVRLHNALDSLITVIVIISLPCFGLYLITKSWLLLILAALPVLYFLRAYEHMMKHDPGLLRTEEHEERMMQIVAGLGEKGKEISEEKLMTFPSVSLQKGSSLPQKNQQEIATGKGSQK
mgnify:CR=1 FL=1